MFWYGRCSNVWSFRVVRDTDNTARAARRPGSLGTGGLVMARSAEDGAGRKRPLVSGPGSGVRSPVLTGIILGIGIMAFVDEVIFHELLQWHSFYWHTDQHGRTLSDGLLHLASTLIILFGAFRLWQDRGSWTAARSDFILAGTVIGLGIFQLFDGIVDHAIFHLHLANEHVCATLNANNSFATCSNDIPYEIVWDAVGILILAAGIIWCRRLTGSDAAQQALE